MFKVGDFVDIVANMEPENPDYTGRFGVIAQFNDKPRSPIEYQFPYSVEFLDVDGVYEFDDFNECEMKKWDNERTMLWKLSH